MNVQIALYLAFGACFGLATYSYQHLFSEGPTRRDERSTGLDVSGRLKWALICAFLWPLMMLTGVHSVWLMAKRKKAAAAQLALNRVHQRTDP